MEHYETRYLCMGDLWGPNIPEVGLKAVLKTIGLYDRRLV